MAATDIKQVETRAANKKKGKVVECSKTPNWNFPQVNRQQVTAT